MMPAMKPAPARLTAELPDLLPCGSAVAGKAGAKSGQYA
jgi:hypothetical protein